MNRFLPFILLFTLLSCSNEKEDAELAFKKDICKRSFAESERLFKEILFVLKGRATSIPSADSIFISDTKKLISWRRNFIKNPTKENLILYADSVEARYSSYKGVENQVAWDIEKNRELLKEENDSLSFYNLLYFTSVAEYNLLRILGSSVSSGNGWYYIPSYLDKEVYGLQDSVYLTVSMYGVDEENSELDFSQVTCSDSKNNISLDPGKIIKSGPNYIIIYVPREKGNYKIEGMIKLKRVGTYNSETLINNGFKVESKGAV